MTPILRWLSIALIIAACPPALATGQSSGYKISSDDFNSGQGDMASASYHLGAAVGDTVFNGRMSSTSYALAPGFVSNVDIAVAKVAPSTLTFGNQNVGTSSSTQSVTVTNLGAAPLSLANIAVSGDFSQTNTCGTAIAPGANCSLVVRFTPTASGARSGNLTFTSNAAGSPYTVSLSGTGVALSQTISFPAIGDKVYGGAPFVPSVSASSGLTVTLTSQTTTVCSVSGLTVTLLKIGACTLQASQAGNASYAAATPVTQSFNVVSSSADVPMPPWAAVLLGGGLLIAMSRYSAATRLVSNTRRSGR